MVQFLTGASAMAAGVIGLFFFRFWRKSGDRLFLAFACSFWLQAGTRVGLALTETDEGDFWYVARLVAFLLILYAIWDKNVSHRT
jgi:hypothetical protein